MKKINYKSDFDFILKLTDCKGEDIGWPDYDWKARLWTGVKANAYEVSCMGGEPSNCFNDEGQIHVVVNDHRMGPGQLNIEFTALLPDEMYPDGDERIVVPAPLGIELVRGAAACPSAVEVEAMLPYIKGDPFTAEDFTSEQWADLQRPATEAAIESMRASARAEAGADAANAAALRAASAADSVREIETTVTEAEAEAARAEAEQQRATEFAAFKGEIDEAKRKVFDDMWLAAVGNYGSMNHTHIEDGVSKPYYLNELWLTYKEALTILIYGRTDKWANGMFAYANIRTNIPARNYGNGNVLSISNLCSTAINLEVFTFAESTALFSGDDLFYSFYNCPKLKAIKGRWRVRSILIKGDGAFRLCGNLEEIDGLVIGENVNLLPFQDCPKLSLATLQGIVTRSQATTCTIVLHPDAYARLTDDLIAEAAEKQITFATT